MSDIDRVIEGLQLFNEKFDKLGRLSFIKSMYENSGITLSWQALDDGGYEEKYERRGPNEEAIEAFVHTFRYFIQDNELSSLRMMADHYSISPIDISLKNEFQEIRKEINDFLDGKTDFPIEYNGEMLTRRKIMDTFVYGGLSHATDMKTKRISEKKKLYDAWMGIPPFRPMIENEFVTIITSLLKAFGWIKNLNIRVLSKLT